MDYEEFLRNKSQVSGMSGFEPTFMPEVMFPFQKHLTDWAVRKGRAAIFADCGLGKTLMSLVWAENVVRHTGGKVLILAPLAVAPQTLREATKFGLEIHHSRDGMARGSITVSNYESLHKFRADDFVGVVCDEVSCAKAFDGKRRKQITRFLSKMQYRLGCTATAAPNDFIELGTISELLGEMTQSDMLSTFFLSSDKKRHSLFKEGDFWNRAKYFFKAHSEEPFWRWVCSWARACRKPSDLGFADDGFVLPPLTVSQQIVPTTFRFDGELFVRIATTLKEQREERRRSMADRCDRVAKLVADHPGHSLVYCQYNEEGDRLEKLIPGAVQVAGCDSDEWKEAAIEWFVGSRCLCQLKRNVIGDKLSTSCNEKHPTTNLCTTQNIETKSSLRPSNGSKITRKKKRSTCENTTPPTNTNGTRRHLSSEPSTTPTGEPSTETILSTEISKRGSSKRAAKRVLTSAMLINCGDSDSLSSITTECLASNVDAVQSAGIHRPTNEPSDTTSITAMRQGELGDCCVPAAISDSGSSTTMRNALKEPPCTCGHVSGNRVLISKPRIVSFGLNLQHCNHITFFPSHSFEQYFQGVRRCWRYGQTEPVHVDVVATEGEAGVTDNLQKKQLKADEMFTKLVAYMNQSLSVAVVNHHTNESSVPEWLSSNNK